MKKVLLCLILLLTLSLSLFACGEGDDGNEEEQEIQADLPLIVDGVPTFNIVMADSLPSKAAAAARYIEFTLKSKFDIQISVLTEKESTEAEVEVLVGDVKSRGDKYSIDGYSLGNDGYVIKLIDTKVIINGGSAEAIVEAISKFKSEILGIEEDEMLDVTMRAEDSFEFIQSEFDVTSLKIDGEDIRKFKICADLENAEEKKAATKIRDAIYLSSGVYLEISAEQSGDNLILITKAVDGKFKVTASDKKLVISYSHENLLSQMVSNFISEKITDGALSFSGEIYNKDTTVVKYDYFGAAGDGKTDDFEAIYNAHETANAGGQPVKATSGKTYYIKNTQIGGYIKSITIQTSVDWTGAKFIIDDTDLIASSNTQGSNSIFKVVSDDDLASIKITDKTVLNAINEDRIGPDTTQITIPKDKIQNWDGPVMVVLYNSSHKVYRRRGYGGYTGEAQKELVILDKNGNVSSETPIMFDYTNLTQIYVYRLDPSRAITVEGGEITTIATKEHTAYVSRNLSVTRSYTTLRGIKHYVNGEVSLREQANGKEGATYSAFFSVGSCTDVTLEGCVLTGRRYYDNGTYEFSASVANNTKLLGCTQSNFWVTVDEDYNIHPATKETPGAKSSQGYVNVNGVYLPICWGAGASNYCKNLEYIDSQMSRFDAHAGVYNGKIVGCEIAGIELTGWGELVIEDTNWYSYGTGSVANSLIYLRNDYGSTWNGTIKIKDVNAYFTTKKEDDSYLFYHSYVNWYFGYTSVFPSVEIDNLKCYDVANKANGEPLDEGYEILLTNNKITANDKMHLEESNSKSNYSIIDADKDGFVDEPIMDRDLDGRLDPAYDLDGDGKIGNTSISYSEAKAAAGDEVGNGTYYGAISLDSDINAYVNLNIVKPPEYIKILNNTGKGSFTLKVINTAGSVSNGEYYGIAENMGGFFGSTKFYYTDTNYFVGTNYPTQKLTDSFEFYH